MNAITADAQNAVGFAADFPEYVDTPYKGDYLMYIEGDCTVLVELDEIVLDLGD